jgi:hypothetical protein
MHRRHALVLALLIGVAAVLGVVAASRTVSAGNASRASTDAAVLKRSQALDRYEASLQKALAQSAAAQTPPAVAGAAAAQPVRIVYHRPPPVVVTTHRQGEHEPGEQEGEADD